MPTYPLGLTFDDGTVVRGPSPAPTVITNPRIHVLSTVEPYATTQCDDTIRDGDVLVVGTTVAVMCAAWPMLVGADSDDTGFHELADGADVRTLGSRPWGRAMVLTICPVDADRYQVDEYIAPDGGKDYTESFALARRIISSRG